MTCHHRAPLQARIASALGALIGGHLADLNFSAVRHVVENFAAVMDGCESPAEQAFLAALLSPAHHESRWTLLRAGSRHVAVSAATRLWIRQQVSVETDAGRYRLDFCVYGDNDYMLAIEIDGAEWHSSPEQIERDDKRDAALVAAGYAILRVPGAVVWRGDEECRAALDEALRPYWRRVA